MFKTIWRKFIDTNYHVHLICGFIIRLAFIYYGFVHDQNSTVPYTDVDYKVFTDAARHISNNNSPYKRHTYRYSPLIAFTVIPNLIIHNTFGKILYCILDIFVAILIRIIVKHAVLEYQNFIQRSNVNLSIKSRKDLLQKKGRGKEIETIGNWSMLVWLYNPLTIGISTRGSCDSIAGLLVLLTLYLIQCKCSYFYAGLIHGLSIHIRLYPIAYSLALFMTLSKYSFYDFEYFKKQNRAIENKVTSGRSIFRVRYLLYLIPNLKQLQLIVGCLLSFGGLTVFFYYLYGYEFLYETYFYHLTRVDTRHNFSLYFYLQYLTTGIKAIGLWQKVLMTLPQVILLLVFSIRYGLNRLSLNFSILTQTIVMVSYNRVLTSQYFVWIMAILPLCLWQIKMKMRSTIFLIVIWFGAQIAWLCPAYFLEFLGQNTFLMIWIQSVSLFCTHMAILGRLVMNFMPVKGHVN